MDGNDEEVQAVINAFWGKRDELVRKHLESGVQGGAARSGSHMEAIQTYVRLLFVRGGPAGEFSPDRQSEPSRLLSPVKVVGRGGGP